MRYSLLFSILILFLFSCKKSKFSSVPSLTFKSANTHLVNRGDVLIMTLSFTDAEGDLTDSLFIQEKVLNCAVGGFAKDIRALPVFNTTKNQEGEILVSYGYNNNYPSPLPNPQCNRNDTAIFRFVLKDKAQHKSDTAVSDKIVILK